MMGRYGSAPVTLDVKESQGRILFTWVLHKMKRNGDVVLLASDGIVWGIWVLVVRFLPFCLVVPKDLLKFVATKGYRYQLSS